MSLEQAVRKITSLPAQRQGLVNRGLLKEGFFADITIFDPSTIADKATYTEPAIRGRSLVFSRSPGSGGTNSRRAAGNIWRAQDGKDFQDTRDRPR